MFDDLIRAAAAKHGLDPEQFRRLIAAESSGNPNAVSPKGAQGLGQLMPGTAREMGVTDPTNPQQNIDASAGYLAKLKTQFPNDPRQPLAAYNWGPGNLARAGGDVSRAPPETQAYLQRIIGQGGPAPAGPVSAAGPVAQTLPAAPPAPPAPPPGAGAPGMAQLPATQPPPPSQQTNNQQMMAQIAQGGLSDRGTLSSLLMGLPGATPGVAPQKPMGVGVKPGFGVG